MIIFMSWILVYPFSTYCSICVFQDISYAQFIVPSMNRLIRHITPSDMALQESNQSSPGMLH